jgi:hypothetical protein
MVAVSRTSIDQAKFITEHDVLKFAGALASAILIPLVMWSFISTHNAISNLSRGLTELHEQVAVLQTKLDKYQDYAKAEFDVSRSQVRAVGDMVKDFRAEAGEFAKSVVAKSAKRR